LHLLLTQAILLLLSLSSIGLTSKLLETNRKRAMAIIKENTKRAIEINKYHLMMRHILPGLAKYLL
jgi:hypothetical protein